MLMILSRNAFAAKIPGGLFGLNLNGGVVQKGLDGIQGADFSEIRNIGLDVSLYYKRGFFIYSLGHNLSPQVKISDVRWTDESVGNYSLDFTTTYFSIGLNNPNFIFELTAGQETLSWSGMAEVGYQDKPIMLTGVKIGKRWTSRGDRRVSYPVFLRYWSRPEKELQFDLKPKENSVVKAGQGFDLMIGISYDLF